MFHFLCIEKISIYFTEPSIYHFFVVLVIFGGPMLYLETFLGQYTQRGCIFLGAQLPIAYGKLNNEYNYMFG